MTPMKSAFKGDVRTLIARGTDGYFGVLANHAPMLAALDFGPLHVRTAEGADKWFAVSNGFFEVRGNKAALLVETCEAKEDIDVERARKAKERAEERLRKRESIDIKRAEAALLRAITRLSIASR